MKKTRTEELNAQAHLVATVALGKPVNAVDEPTLHNVARALANAAKRSEAQVADLPPMATPAELQKARSRRAVRRGNDVFLPSWRELCTGLPNALLRSALWSVAAIGHGKEDAEAYAGTLQSSLDSEGASLPAQGDVRIINRGPKLGWYDRRVFAACLDHYKDDRPLYKATETSGVAEKPSWVPVSYLKFLESMGAAYSTDGHNSLRKSFERLSAISLHVRSRGLEVQMPRLLEVSFADGESRGEKAKASDLILFRVLEPIAELYGPANWTAVPHEALNAGRGLYSWLATFYSSHAHPYPIQIKTLYAIAGATCLQAKFKFQLKEALNALSKPDVPDGIRVSDYQIDKSTVTVGLVRWGKTLQSEVTQRR